MAADAIVTAHLGAAGFTTHLSDGKHEWSADEPATLGGADLGPAPAALLLSSLGGMAAGILPMWLINSGNFDAISGMSAILGVLHFALAMVEAIGVVLLVWALVRLLRTRTLPAA